MNSTFSTTFARISAMTVTLALAAVSVYAALPTGIVGGKGAATLLTKPQAAAVAPAQPSMSCSQCQNEYTTLRDTSARGANKPTVVAMRHLCPACDTAIQTVGVGKAKRDVATHTCISPEMQNKGCCSMAQVAAGRMQ